MLQTINKPMDVLVINKGIASFFSDAPSLHTTRNQKLDTEWNESRTGNNVQDYIIQR